MPRPLSTLGALVLALGLPPALEGQARTVITGRVTNQSAVPVAGARIVIAGLQLATATNEAGVYRLVIPADRPGTGPDTLLVSRIGFRPRAIPVELTPGENRVDITVAELALSLEDIVVTGTAGNLERRAQAATVATIDASAIAPTAPVTNLPELLAARVPGVTVNRMTGSSGGTSLVRIRGVSSISLSNDPLVFVDGVRIDNRNLGSSSIYFGSAISTLNTIQPNDIESIEIVKGPAAATLYGADASAGVIQIITKRGRSGPDRFGQTLTAEYARVEPHFTPPSNFAACPASLVGASSPNPLCRGQAVGTIVQDNPVMREGLLTNGAGQSLGWSGRGGGNNFGYFLSYGYDHEDGTVPQNGYTRHTARTNFTLQARPNLTFDVGVGVARETNDQANVGDNLYGVLDAVLGSPLTVGSAANGWFAPNRDGAAIASISNRFSTIRFTPSVTARYQPVPWFTNRLTLGADLSRIQAEQFFPKNDRGSFGGATDDGQIIENRQNVDNWTLDYLGNVRHSFGARKDLTMDLSLGAQIIALRNDVVAATGQGFVTNSNNAISSATTISASGGSSEQRSVGLIGQWQTGWRDRLFVQLGARVDENSAFGSDRKRFFLPKAGVSYVISEEPFWRRSLGFIGTLRLRAAYGTTGRAPNPGAALETFSSAPYLIGPGVTGAGVVPLNPGNSGLRSEKGTELEAGFDAGLWNDRIGVEVTYFDKVTKDLILQRPISPSLGFALSPFANIGEVVNRGVEVAINARILDSRNFAWESRISLSTLHNELRSLGGVDPFETGLLGIMSQAYREGDPLGAWYGRGVISVDAGANRAIVTDTAIYQGNPIATYSGNASADLTFFRNLRVTGVVDFTGPHKKFNLQEWYREKAFTSTERVQQQASLSAEERLRLFGPYFTAGGGPVPSALVAGDYLQDAGFVRLREASATYTLPASVARWLHGSNASITIGGRNLALWTKYRGPDPEALSYVPNDGRLLALDFMVLPQPRRFFARINLGF